MAVTSVKLKRQRRVGRSNEDRTAQKVYFVVCDDINDGPSVAETANDGATAIEAIGDAYSADPADELLVCTSIQSEDVDEDGFVMQVTCDFSTSTGDGKSGGSVGESPTAQPCIESFDFAVERVPISKDRNGNLIKNSAGDPLRDVEEDVYDLVMTYQKTVDTFDRSLAASMIGKVNADSWNGFPAETLKVIKFAGTERWINGHKYVDVNLEIQHREDKWSREFLDQGFRRKTTAGGTTIFLEMQDDNGQPLSSPVKLDGSGGRLPPGGTDVFITVDTLKSQSFGVLNPYADL